jgi:hypothetical protein
MSIKEPLISEPPQPVYRNFSLIIEELHLIIQNLIPNNELPFRIYLLLFLSKPGKETHY